MVPMPVRVKLPPADIGEIISPGCAFLATTTPANGARIFGDVDLLALLHDTRLQRVVVGLRAVELGLRHDAALLQWPHALQLEIGFVDTHLRLGQDGTRRGELAFGEA